MAYHVGHYEVYDEGKWWQLGEEDLVVTCDGPCCISKPMNDSFSFCPICYDFGFCENCVKLLRAGELGMDVCSAKHVEHLIYVPPLPQNLELKKSQMFADGKVMEIGQWLTNLKKEWNF
ncbi:NACHT and TPR domain protein [Penicillium longicatenatum]|uniref:NACHT and TPR domain protein n=1 Tax=Penicillium longicatenatum TaxID=1561947 RepID=UPI002547DF0C|nr:NACHT and TPR domain protein [Penicillium longicatenatum]KAJ5639649.1 NACHT and TPR domain protein [Penicillium longicatenatum]